MRNDRSSHSGMVKHSFRREKKALKTKRGESGVGNENLKTSMLYALSTGDG